MDESGQGPAEGVTYQASLPGTSEEGAVLDESMLERYRPTAEKLERMNECWCGGNLFCRDESPVRI